MLEMGVLSIWILPAASLAGIVFLLATGRSRRVEQRLSDLSSADFLSGGGTNAQGHPARRVEAQISRAIAGPLDRAAARRLEQGERKKTLKQRLVQAGLYRPGAVRLFLVLRVVMLLAPLAGGVGLGPPGGFSPAGGGG